MQKMVVRKRLLQRHPASFGRGYAHEIAIYVPSTRKGSTPISPRAFHKREREVERFMAGEYGGDTATRGTGDYLSRAHKLVREPVEIVKSFTTAHKLHDTARDVKRFVKSERRKWGQESIGVERDGHFYFVR